MEDLLRSCYDILADAGMSRPPYQEWRNHALDNAEVWPIRVHNGDTMEMVGFVLFKGQSVHIAVKREWHGRWIRPSMLKAWRKHYQHDCDLYATPDTENRAACELAERLGFRLQKTLGKSSIYVKERTTHEAVLELQGR